MEKFTTVSVEGLEIGRRLNSRTRHMFNDVRLENSWQELSSLMYSKQSSVIHQISENRAQMLRFYYLLRSKRVCVREMIKHQCTFKKSSIVGRHLLVLGDSTGINLQSHGKRISNPSGIGVLADNKTLGFFAHANLAVDAHSNDIVGLSDLLFLCRGIVNKGPDGKKTKSKSIEKESQKWILGAQNSYAALKEAAGLTFVFDREADDFNIFKTLHQMPRAHFVIRSFRDRYVVWRGQKIKLSACLEGTPSLGTYEVKLPALDHYSSTNGKRIKRKSRRAIIQFSASAIQLPLPSNTPTTTHKTGSEPLSAWAVHAKEITPNLPESEEPIDWTLISTHPCESAEQVLQVIQYYLQRWIIEQLFRTMKKEGFAIENTELETFEAIQKQTAMTFMTATKVLQLVYARNRYDSQPIEEVFNEQEQAVLKTLNQKLQGTTQDLQNPFPPTQTSWATWIIARLGGWKGYLSQRPPGPTTLKRGVEIFNNWVEAFAAFADDN